MGPLRFRRLSVLAIAGALLFALNACTVTPDSYIALGDSYTAGPLIPDQQSPLGCLRSNHNYPSLVAPTLGLAHFIDISCSGAETGEMFNPQDVTPGPANPAQLDMLSAYAKVVTIGIGGNDIGFSSIAKGCVNLDPTATPCMNKYLKPGGGDTIRDDIAATRPKIDAVLAAARSKAPNAKIFLIGYPDILPDTGNGCWPTVPILGPDTVFLRGIEKALNTMLADSAAANGVTFLDIYTGTIGHDACKGSNAWIESVVPGSSAAPVHPNANGMIGIANILGPTLRAAAAS